MLLLVASMLEIPFRSYRRCGELGHIFAKG